MKIILVPHTPYKYRASVWAAAVGTDSPPQGLIITLQPGGRSIAVSDRSWRKLSYSRGKWAQRLRAGYHRAGFGAGKEI